MLCDREEKRASSPSSRLRSTRGWNLEVIAVQVQQIDPNHYPARQLSRGRAN